MLLWAVLPLTRPDATLVVVAEAAAVVPKVVGLLDQVANASLPRSLARTLAVLASRLGRDEGRRLAAAEVEKLLARIDRDPDPNWLSALADAIGLEKGHRDTCTVLRAAARGPSGRGCQLGVHTLCGRGPRRLGRGRHQG